MASVEGFNDLPFDSQRFCKRNKILCSHLAICIPDGSHVQMVPERCAIMPVINEAHLHSKSTIFLPRMTLKASTLSLDLR